MRDVGLQACGLSNGPLQPVRRLGWPLPVVRGELGCARKQAVDGHPHKPARYPPGRGPVRPRGRPACDLAASPLVSECGLSQHCPARPGSNRSIQARARWLAVRRPDSESWTSRPGIPLGLPGQSSKSPRRWPVGKIRLFGPLGRLRRRFVVPASFRSNAEALGQKPRSKIRQRPDCDGSSSW